MTKCSGLTIKHTNCQKNQINNTRFCKTHQYLNDYTDEMIQNLDVCKGCRRNYSKIGQKDCICTNKVKSPESNNIEDSKNTKIIEAKCKKNDCKYLAKEHGYCLKHKLNAFKELVENEGLVICSNYVRGCKNKLQPDTYKRCEECREKENKDSRDKRIKLGELAKIAIENIKNKQEIKSNKIDSEEIKISDGVNINGNTVKKDIKINQITNNGKIKIQLKKKMDNLVACTKCRQFRDFSLFQVGDNIKAHCQICREKQKKADAKRSDRVRDYSEYEKRPEVIAKRKQYKIDNPEKFHKYWMSYRQRKIIEDIEAYFKKNALTMKLYRQNHPEKFKSINLKKRLNPETKYNTYKLSAEKRGIKWDLEINSCIALFYEKCFYCNQIYNGIDISEDKRTLNGIDRLDNNEGYTINNSVSCCKMCNSMKLCWDPIIFIKICENILIHLGKIIKDVNYLPINTISYVFEKYQISAKKRNIPFQISKQNFDSCVKLDCYLCGKKNNNSHQNGIDRFNNEIGYTIDNIKTCCKTCNFLKKNYSYDQLINKLLEIIDNNSIYRSDENIKNQSIQNYINVQKQTNISLTEIAEPIKRVKLSIEEKREKARLRKQESRLRAKLKYNAVTDAIIINNI